jgi:exodeoxyribonuclease-3
MNNTLRVITWNCRRAKSNSAVWDYFSELAPDIALLQEVSGIPENVRSSFACYKIRAIGKSGLPQRFTTAILVKGKISDSLSLSASLDWVVKELSLFEGNLVAKQLKTDKGSLLNVISVYSPAWPVNRSRLENIDTTGVRLVQNPDVWVADLLWASLNHIQPKATESWIIGGDFNLSETFDEWHGGPRGNKEYLDRMTALGFIESLRYSKGKLTPTFRNTGNGLVKHQMDHLFITQPLAQNLINCDVGNSDRVFGRGLSDHLPIFADFQL